MQATVECGTNQGMNVSFTNIEIVLLEKDTGNWFFSDEVKDPHSSDFVPYVKYFPEISKSPDSNEFSDTTYTEIDNMLYDYLDVLSEAN